MLDHNQTLGHIYWSQFPPLHEVQRQLLAVFILTAVVFSFVGNLAVVLIYSRTPKSRKRKCFLIAVSVLGNGCNLLYLPGVFKLFFGKTTFSFTECVFHGFFVGWLALTCILLLSLIAVERCLIVCRPFSISKFTTYHKCWAIGVAVTYALAISSPPLFGWSRYAPIGHRWSCSFSFVSNDDGTRSYLIFMVVTGFMVPCLIITISYILILRAVYLLEIRRQWYSRHTKEDAVPCESIAKLSPGDGAKNRDVESTCASSVTLQKDHSIRTNIVNRTENAHDCTSAGTGSKKPLESARTNLSRRLPSSLELHMALLMLTVTIAFLISWTPFTVIVVVAQINPGSINPDHVTISLVLAKLFTLWNPIIYGWKEKLFRNKCKLMLNNFCAHFHCSL